MLIFLLYYTIVTAGRVDTTVCRASRFGGKKETKINLQKFKNFHIFVVRKTTNYEKKRCNF